MSGGVAARVGGRRRLAACLSLVALATEVVVVIVGLHGQLARLPAALLLLLAATVSGWFAVTRRGLLRTLGVVGAAVTAGLLALVVLTGDAHGLTLLVVVVLGVCSVGLTRFALRRDRGSIRKLPVPGAPVGPACHAAPHAVHPTLRQRARTCAVDRGLEQSYLLTRIAGVGTRARLDTGTLGVSAVELRWRSGRDRLLAGRPPAGYDDSAATPSSPVRR